jgi:hypothetical protein
MKIKWYLSIIDHNIDPKPKTKPDIEVYGINF